MQDRFTLLICFNSEYAKEGIDPYSIELRHTGGMEAKEGIIHYAASEKQAIKFAEQYVKDNENVLSYEFGDLGK